MGLTLVFDMDQTILDSSDPYLFQTPSDQSLFEREIKKRLNWNIVNILKRAVKLRPDKVTSIFLLTNNSFLFLVAALDKVLRELTMSTGRYRGDNGLPTKDYFFDSIMMRQHSSRPKTVDDNPPKRLQDIINMISPTDALDSLETLKNTYFFDDIDAHVLKSEFDNIGKGDHYIHITPPYKKGVPDTTNYRPVLEALSLLDGEPAEFPEKYGRNRSNTRVNANNLELPPPSELPDEKLKKLKLKTAQRHSLMGAFNIPTQGGYKKSRKRLRSRRRTRKRKYSIKN
jgi:hypothetical protein